MAIFGDRFAAYFGGQDHIRNDLITRGGRMTNDDWARREQQWADPGYQGNGLDNPYTQFYRQGAKAFVNEAPPRAPMEGYEWASKAQRNSLGGQTLYGWYQRPINALTQEQQDIQNAFAQTPVQTGMGGLLGQIAPLIQQQVAANPAASAIQPYIENRDPLMQFANPVSPYDYMPMLPSVQANPYLQSDIGGVQVNHNVGLLSYLNPTQAMYDYNTLTAPVTNPYNYNSAGSMFTTGELENLLQKYGMTRQSDPWDSLRTNTGVVEG